jgi:tRNA nucleotidyltransferase (CCA-adding enzyme)
MKAYVVGGAVRDARLGLPVSDRDWVVVGSTPEEMLSLGYRAVGRDFPVFLHPQTHEEHALARTERKSGPGYRGFQVHAAPEVTLEDDLRRRDLTINAMALAEDGALIDPFGGERDLRAGVLRHVSEAFVEDPVRILRVARFAARFRFRVADETLALMRQIVDSGEAANLVAERVWQELARGLTEPHPQAMFDVLADCGYLMKHLPELAPDAAILARAAAANASLAVRWALLFWPAADCASRADALAARLRVPGEPAELARLACVQRDALRAASQASPAELLATLKRADAFRRAERLAELLRTLELAEPGDASKRSAARLAGALQAAVAVDAGAIARAAASPGEIAAQLDQARERAIAAALGV